jgi:hypothetical protein
MNGQHKRAMRSRVWSGGSCLSEGNKNKRRRFPTYNIACDELPQTRSLNGHRRSGAHAQAGALDTLHMGNGLRAKTQRQ